MASLPKHLDAKPTLMHADIVITVDGGDIRQAAVMEAYEAAAVAINLAADTHGLDLCLSRRLRSMPPLRLRMNLRKRGFRVPLEPPPSADAVDPVASREAEPSTRDEGSVPISKEGR